VCGFAARACLVVCVLSLSHTPFHSICWHLSAAHVICDVGKQIIVSAKPISANAGAYSGLSTPQSLTQTQAARQTQALVSLVDLPT